jgi:uncharacterized protein (DUF2147 family)
LLERRVKGEVVTPLAMLLVTATVALSPSAAAAVEPSSDGKEQAAETTFSADSIVGEWWTENKDGRIKFEKHEDGTYRGVLTWGLRPRSDRFNKDPRLRARPLIGMVIMWNLVYADGKYADGYVYNPEDGGTYRMKAWLTTRNSLKLRGYMGISLLGQTQTWTRYH